ncbi:glycosyltransferase family 9 protein [candidate division KSB1 bacterium]
MVLKKIRDKFPQAYITLVSWNSLYELFDRSELLDDCFSNSQYLRMTPSQLQALSQECHIYIDLQTTEESAIGVKRSQAEVKVAVFLPPGPIKYEELYTNSLRIEPGEHVSRYLLRGFQEALGTDPELEPIPIPRPESVVRHVHVLLRELGLGEGEFLAGLHPGAKDAVRRWLPERWAGVVDWLTFSRAARVLLLGTDLVSWGGAEIDDQKDNARIWRLAKKKPVDMTGATPDPVLLAEVIRQMGLYIGLDTGPTHLAAAVGVPILSLYRYHEPAHYDAWKIIAPNSKIITGEELEEVQVDEVTREIKLLLSIG